MTDGLIVGFRIALIGIGATLALDIWSLLLRAAFRAPFPNYAMVGRWIGGFPRGRFVHEDIASAPAVASERLMGWTAHYVTGILYAFLLIAIAGVNWLSAPTLLPALMVGVATVAAPLFIMQPAMGLGVAASKAIDPNGARLRSLLAHIVFGIGLYLSATLTASFFL
ncbi:MAG: DUF2938 domain-containing protein [Hyphomonadaceae bacterium]|nr:DUF2938 domain-containing protein [Hyphomonadaceae bacterium]